MTCRSPWGRTPRSPATGTAYALVGRDDRGRLVLGPVGAIMPQFKRGWTFELKRREQDRVLKEIATLARRYSAHAIVDQHQSTAVVERLRRHGVSASVWTMTRETKMAAFRELRDRLYDGSLILPDHPDLLDEIRRVRLKLEQGGAKIILPKSSKGHCDMVQALAVGVFHRRVTVERGDRGRRAPEYVPLHEADMFADLDGRPKRSAPADPDGRKAWSRHAPPGFYDGDERQSVSHMNF